MSNQQVATAVSLDGEIWVLKADAERLTGLKERAVERYVSAGSIRKRILPREPGERVGRVVLARADVMRLADPEERRKVQAFSNAPRPENATAPRALPPAPALPESYTPAPPEPRPWLTLEEAAAFSGLPTRWLKRAASLGNVEAINVGSERRVVWRFHRDSLRGQLSIRLFATAGV